MMSLFDDEEIIKTYAKDMAREAAETAAYDADRATAERMIVDRKMPLEQIARYVPSISLDELKRLEEEILQLS